MPWHLFSLSHLCGPFLSLNIHLKIKKNLDSHRSSYHFHVAARFVLSRTAGYSMVLIMLRKHQFFWNSLSWHTRFILGWQQQTGYTSVYSVLFNIYSVSLLNCILQSETPSTHPILSLPFHWPSSLDTWLLITLYSVQGHSQWKYFFLCVHKVLYVLLTEYWYRYADCQDSQQMLMIAGN